MDNSKRWVELADPGPLEEVAKLRAFLEKTIKGQSKAIDSVCKIYEYDLTLRWLEERPGPLGTLMFVGPSGVGKTELCRMLSLYFMGSVDAMLKIDCSAFSQPHMIHSLIGAPHGYVGYNTEPMLSTAKLMSRIKNKKSPEPSIGDEAENKKRDIMRRIGILRSRLGDLEEDFFVRREFVKGLTDRQSILCGSGNGQPSIAELFKDKEIRPLITEMLYSSTVESLDKDIDNPAEDVAILLGLISELKQIYREYKETETEIIKQRQEYWEVSQKYIDGDITKLSLRDNQSANNKNSPRLVLLFDEIEKADLALHNLLLQIMEDGQLVLANGDVTDLRNAFIIMTSNVGAFLISGLLKDKGMGFRLDKRKKGFNEEDSSFKDLEGRMLKVVEKEMEKTFSSAFRGRIDDIVTFRPLTRKDFNDILDYQIEIFAQSLGLLELDLVVDQEVKNIIIDQSLHRPEVGSRLLGHKLKSLLKTPLGHRLAGRDSLKGTIRASVGSNKKIKFLIKEKNKK